MYINENGWMPFRPVSGSNEQVQMTEASQDAEPAAGGSDPGYPRIRPPGDRRQEMIIPRAMLRYPRIRPPGDRRPQVIIPRALPRYPRIRLPGDRRQEIQEVQEASIVRLSLSRGRLAV